MQPAATAAALAAALTLASPAAAQVVVSALARGDLPLEETADLQLLRYGAVVAAPGPLAVGAELSAGDLLSGVASDGGAAGRDGRGAAGSGVPGDTAAGDLQVELTCRGGSRLWLSRAFRLQVLPLRSGGGCAVELLAGGVEVFDAGGTEVRSGGLSVEGGRARYSVRVDAVAAQGEAAAAARALRVLVFEGAVRVAGPAGEARVAAGRVLTVEVPRDRPQQALMAEGPLEEAEAGGVGRSARLPSPPAAGAAMEEGAASPPSEPAAGSAAAVPLPDAAAAMPEATGEPAASAAAAGQPAALASEPAPPSGSAPPDRAELRRWLEAGRYGEVAQELEPHLSGSALTSVDYYLLAEAYAGLRRPDRSAAYARRALRLDEVDDRLSSRELAAAQNLAREKP